jgi:hypothetical protein
LWSYPIETGFPLPIGNCCGIAAESTAGTSLWGSKTPERLIQRQPIAGRPRATLDTIAQIRLFAKLKLTKCAPILGWPQIGFFMSAQAGQTRFGVRDMRDTPSISKSQMIAGAAAHTESIHGSPPPCKSDYSRN